MLGEDDPARERLAIEQAKLDLEKSRLDIKKASLDLLKQRSPWWSLSTFFTPVLQIFLPLLAAIVTYYFTQLNVLSQQRHDDYYKAVAEIYDPAPTLRISGIRLLAELAPRINKSGDALALLIPRLWRETDADVLSNLQDSISQIPGSVDALADASRTNVRLLDVQIFKLDPYRSKQIPVGVFGNVQYQALKDIEDRLPPAVKLDPNFSLLSIVDSVYHSQDYEFHSLNYPRSQDFLKATVDAVNAVKAAFLTSRTLAGALARLSPDRSEAVELSDTMVIGNFKTLDLRRCGCNRARFIGTVDKLRAAGAEFYDADMNDFYIGTSSDFSGSSVKLLRLSYLGAGTAKLGFGAAPWWLLATSSNNGRRINTPADSGIYPGSIDDIFSTLAFSTRVTPSGLSFVKKHTAALRAVRIAGSQASEWDGLYPIARVTSACLKLRSGDTGCVPNDYVKAIFGAP